MFTTLDSRRWFRVMLVFGLMCLNPKGLLSQELPDRSVRLNNYNNWSFTSEATSDRSAMLNMVAARENVCFTENWNVTPAEIKSLNPNAKVYRIFDLSCKNRWDSDWSNKADLSRLQTPMLKSVIDKNNWWLRDGKGQIVKENDDTWLLDVGKRGFREAFLQNTLSRMSGKGFDGVVLDYWWPSMVSLWITGRGLTPPSDYPTDDDWFFDAWLPFVDYVAQGLHDAGYRIIGNCVGEYGTSDAKNVWQRSKVDGVIYEQWAFDWPKDGRGAWLDSKLIESRIRAMSFDPLEAWVAELGLLESDPELDRKRMVSLAMYYVAIPSSQEDRSYHYCRNRKVYWDTLWDLNIGTPKGPATKLPDEFFWSREFTRGLVLLNYSPTKEVTYALSRSYRDSGGRRVSGKVRIPSHSAMILTVD